MTFDFIRDLIAHPDKMPDLSDNSTTEFKEKNFDKKQVESSKDKVLVKVEHTFEVIGEYGKK